MADTDPLMLSTAEEAADAVVPASLVCPITQELFEDPVIAADGFTYERPAIERWLGMGPNRRSPTTNAPLAHRGLTANLSLASLVAAYRSRLGAELVVLVSEEDAGKEKERVSRCRARAAASRRRGPESRSRRLGG